MLSQTGIREEIPKLHVSTNHHVINQSLAPKRDCGTKGRVLLSTPSEKSHRRFLEERSTDFSKIKSKYIHTFVDYMTVIFHH